MRRQTLTFANYTVLQRWDAFCKMHHNILSLKQQETEELEQGALVKSGCRFCLGFFCLLIFVELFGCGCWFVFCVWFLVFWVFFKE